jgi:hypothetical protein
VTVRGSSVSGLHERLAQVLSIVQKTKSIATDEHR